MAKNQKLMLTESVDNLGIVGDVVNVRTGYARNFLLPRGLATQPSDDALKAVAAKRADAQRQLAEQRKQREAMVEKMVGVDVTMERSCNDQGVLYAAVTQQDIADALGVKGYAVKAREVRLGQTIKRVDAYDVQVKLDSDLVVVVKVRIQADRKLEDPDEREEMEFDNEGNLIEKPKGAAKEKPEAKADPAAAASARPAAAQQRETKTFGSKSSGSSRDSGDAKAAGGKGAAKAGDDGAKSGKAKAGRKPAEA